MIWERGLYDDMKMITGSAATGATNSATAIRILENTSYMNSGYTVGNLTFFTCCSRMSYVSNNDSNVQKFSSVTTATNQLLEFGYDADNYMPGGLIAPARRLGTFYPASNGDFSTEGFNRIDRNINWVLQNPNFLFYDSFQRNASNTIGNGWRETESAGTDISTDGQQMRFESFDSMVQARNSFPIQRSGTLSASFYMDAQRTGTLSNDYQLRFQLGRCDLMDNDSSNESGIAVNLLWGGVNAGLTSENSLGYRLANGTTSTLGTVNSGQAYINVDLDFASKTFKITTPLGTTASIPFQNDVAVDCMKFMAKNINNESFPRRGVHHLKLLQAN